MAVSTPIDINRSTENVLLPPEVSSEIWAKTQEASAIMSLAQRVTLPAAGQEFQTITGDVEPNWVSETMLKPISKPTFGQRSWKGYKMAVVIPFSDEFRRDKARLYDEIIARVPATFGKKFDKTVLGVDTKPGDLFDTFADTPTVDFESDVWSALVETEAKISEGDGILDGWALAPKAKSILLNAKDGMNRPLFINSMTSDRTVGTLMGSPTHFSKGMYVAGDSGSTPEQLGIAGDWSSCRYGVIESISMKTTDQGTLHTDQGDIYLWQQNMFAVLFEFEVGFMIQWPEHFVKLVGSGAAKVSLSAKK